MVKPGLRKLYLPVNVFRFRSGKTARTLSFDRSYLLHIRMGGVTRRTPPHLFGRYTAANANVGRWRRFRQITR